MLAHFRFECSKTLARDPADPTLLTMPRDFEMFPRSLGQVIVATGVASFRLSLARGLWDPRWGEATLADGASLNAPQGAELVAEFRGPVGEERVEQGWKTLTSRLAGLSCASLNFLATATAVARPQLGGVGPDPSALAEGKPTRAPQGHTRYGAIGRETVCTENLTPWIKHLPCGGSAGLAARIAPTRLFASQHHVLGLEVASRDTEGGGVNVTVTQTLSAVLDKMGSDGIDSLLQTSPSSTCSAMAGPTSWHLDLPREMPPQSLPSALWGLPHGAFTKLSHGWRASIPIRQAGTGSTADLQEHHYETAVDPIQGAPIEVTKYLLDADGLRGQLVTRIVNRDPTRGFRILTYEAVPWYIRLFFHTLDARVNGTSALQQAWHVSLTPAKDRASMAQFELGMDLPPGGNITFSVSCIKAFLRSKDFPPDVSRGLDLPAGSVTYQPWGGGKSVRVFTESILVPMPFPDNSMPFNAITYVCTLIALTAGAVMNVVVMKPTEPQAEDKAEDKAKEHQGPSGQPPWLARLPGLFGARLNAG